MTQKRSFKDIINQPIPVLIDFHAEWCGPCKAMSPIIKELAQKLGDKAKVIKIDIDRNQAVSQKLGIRGVPTFILYKAGKEHWRRSGMQSLHQLQHVVESAI